MPAAETLNRHQMAITTEDDIAVVRRKVQTIAKDRGFDTFASAAVTTATSEIARNVFVHAEGGEVEVEEITDGVRFGIRIDFRDHGPGIADLTRALAGGFSTARSLGLGLSGSKRLVDEFAIESKVGEGTRVTMVKWKRF